MPANDFAIFSWALGLGDWILGVPPQRDQATVEAFVISALPDDALADLVSHWGVLRSCDNYEWDGAVNLAVRVAYERGVDELAWRDRARRDAF